MKARAVAYWSQANTLSIVDCLLWGTLDGKAYVAISCVPVEYTRPYSQ